MLRLKPIWKMGTRRAVLVLLACVIQLSQRAASPSVPGSDLGQNVNSIWNSPEEGHEAPQRRGPGPAVRGVYKSRITPHWFHDDMRFWYRNDLREQTKEFIVVDAENGTRQPAFDHQRLAEALSKATGETYKPDRLPFSDIDFVDGGKAIRFEAA